MGYGADAGFLKKCGMKNVEKDFFSRKDAEVAKIIKTII